MQNIYSKNSNAITKLTIHKLNITVNVNGKRGELGGPARWLTLRVSVSQICFRKCLFLGYILLNLKII